MSENPFGNPFQNPFGNPHIDAKIKKDTTNKKEVNKKRYERKKK